MRNGVRQGKDNRHLAHLEWNMLKSMLDGCTTGPYEFTLDSEAVSTAIVDPGNLVKSGRVAKIESIIHEFFMHFDNSLGDFVPWT